MKKTIPISMIALLILTLTNCATVRIAIQYDDEADFTRYKKFTFVKPQQKQGKQAIKNPFFSKEILREIRPVLEEKGLSEAASKNEADILVVFYASVQNRRGYVPPTYHVGRWGRIRHATPGHTIHYKEGTLVIDIVDRAKKELVWQGVGKDVLDRHHPHENLVDAVREILKAYPPEG